MTVAAEASPNRSKFLVAGIIVALLAGAVSGFVLWKSHSANVRYAYVAFAGEIVPLTGHRLLITDFGRLDRTGGQVIITDYSDHLLWKYHGRLNNPHSAYPTSNGDILISDTGDNRVIEVNRKSRIVWNSDDLGGGDGRLGQGKMSDGSRLDYPNDAKLLSNGLVMISCRLQNRVIQINRQGRIVHSTAGFLNRQHNPDMLANGNLLIADSGWNRVVEVNPQNHIVWQFGSAHTYQLSWPRDANLLPNGNILITDSDHNRLVEVNRKHQFVRYWTDLQRPYSAASLPNGNILVGDGPGPGVVEENQHNTIVWSLNHDPSEYLKVVKPKVSNGGFERELPGRPRLADGWNRNDALAYSLPPDKRVTMVRDCTVARIGKCSGRITYRGDSNGIYFSQFVAVEPGHSYRFSGWIKTKGVKPCHPCAYGPQSLPGHTAEYELGFYPPQGMYPPGPILSRYQGTTPWTHDTAIFTVPANIHGVEIDGYLRGQGTVWYDGVSLKRLD